jgi:hypothetical protein
VALQASTFPISHLEVNVWSYKYLILPGKHNILQFSHTRTFVLIFSYFFSYIYSLKRWRISYFSEEVKLRFLKNSCYT